MNVYIPASDDAREMDAARESYIRKLKDSLDAAFTNKITTPEQVRKTFKLLCTYEAWSGKKYIRTFEENSIV